MSEQQTVTLPIEVMNKVLNVLGQMPYAQVAEVMGAVQQNAQVSGGGDLTAAEPDPAPADEAA